jgi:hypothetical protein
MEEPWNEVSSGLNGGLQVKKRTIRIGGHKLQVKYVPKKIRDGVKAVEKALRSVKVNPLR